METAIRLLVRNLRGPVVGPIDLDVACGTCATISGASGAGKSLFLRMIADLVPNEGEVRLGDCRREAVDASSWRRKVIYAGGAGWWATTVSAHFPPETMAFAATHIERLGMEQDYLQRPVATLSTGEGQRLTLIRALARKPQVLLLDEATSALDPAGVGRVEDLLRDELASGTIVILVTHDAGQARRLAQARYVMTAGRLSPA